jgi:hypothetical protein
VSRPAEGRTLASVQLLAEDGWRAFAAWEANPDRGPC